MTTANRYSDLAEVVASIPPDELHDFCANLAPDDLAVIEHVMGDLTGEGWRATPATLAAALDSDFRLWRYVTLLGQRFVAAANGEDPHQIWELPSQYGKTSILIWGAVWLLDRDPTIRIMYVSYDANKAVEEGRRARDIATKHASALRFRLRPDVKAAGKWMTDEGGGFYATGIGGAIVGFPQDVVLLDDLIKGWQAAHSAAQRESVWNVYRTQVRLRVQSSDDPIISAGTRWHEDDPAARMMRASGEPDGDRWSVVRLAAIAEAPNPTDPDPLLREPDPLGRAPGEVLEPERFPEREVLARRAALGTYLWSALEQQRPAPEEGGDIKRDWWKWYSIAPAAFDATTSSWDCKLKDKEAGDYVVGQVWGRTGNHYWLLDMLRGQWNFATTKAAVALLAVRWPDVKRHIIENAGNGPEVLEQLKVAQSDYRLHADVIGALGVLTHEIPLVEALIQAGMVGLVPENPKGDKTVRVRAYSALIEAGNVHVPEDERGAVLVNEAAAVGTGAGAHDDAVDAMTQALKHLSEPPLTIETHTDHLRRQLPSIGSGRRLTGPRRL